MSGGSTDLDRLERDLEKVLGAKRVSRREPDLTTYAVDMWPRLLIARRYGAAVANRPDMVVWPETVREVAAIVRTARAAGVPCIPYGGGSGVCGGVVPIRGGVTIDLKRMDSLLSVHSAELECDVEGGLNGERFERALQRRGYTFGNFPSSIYCSTVGGWLATRAAGQMSTKYGKVEDRVAGVTVVTGRGDVIETDNLARASRGPNWTQLLLGSEGTLGIITSARLRLAPAPALRVLRGFEFESVAHGVEAIRRVMQRGLRPAVVRLYDEFDTFLNSLGGKGHSTSDARDPHQFAPAPEVGHGALPHMPQVREDKPANGLLTRAIGLLGRPGRRRSFTNTLRQEAIAAALSRPRFLNSLAGTVIDRFARTGCKMIIGVEGARIRTEIEARLVLGELERAGGKDVGEEPGRKWLEHRYAVSYRMSPMFRDGMFVDTMEVASSWERLMDMYAAVKEAISQYAIVMAHFSHAYSEGCSIYFSFAAHGETQRDAERIYDAIWREGLAATSRAGGTISHHHGVGLLKSAHMTAEHREAMVIFHALKASMDPDNIMNPGKMGLDGHTR